MLIPVSYIYLIKSVRCLLAKADMELSVCHELRDYH